MAGVGKGEVMHEEKSLSKGRKGKGVGTVSRGGTVRTVLEGK